MSLMTMLEKAQGGSFFANAAAAAGIEPNEAREALGTLCPAIAQQLRARAENDSAAFDNLLDLLEEGGDTGDLDDPVALTGPEAVADGNAILEDVYGSRNAAITAARKLAPQIAETGLTKLTAIAAVSVLAALSRSTAMTPLAAAAPAKKEGGGLLDTIISAVIKGAIQGASRQLAPRRRRRRYSSYLGRTRRRKTTRRRARTPSLDDIFGEILGTRRR